MQLGRRAVRCRAHFDVDYYVDSRESERVRRWRMGRKKCVALADYRYKLLSAVGAMVFDLLCCDVMASS